MASRRSGWRGAGMRVVAVGAVSQVDLYLDTDDQRLHRAGLRAANPTRGASLRGRSDA